MTVSGKRILPVVLGLILTSTILASALPNNTAGAAQITPRKLILEGVGAVGGSTPGGTVNHHFVFTAPGSTAIKSIKFTYCTQARVALPCTAPTNMDASSATVGALVGTTGWTKQSSSANTYVLTNAAAADIHTGAEITLNSVKNTTDANTAFYVDITTYTSADASTGATDDGWVAAATANQIQLQGTMPESLIFCAGGTISLNGQSLPDCTTATSATVNFNQLFSPSDTAFATSQMAASTNAANGYSITVNGPTMTSGGNTITAMNNGSGGPTTSVKGTSQFGLDLVANDGSAYAGAPNIIAYGSQNASANITPASSSSTLRGEPTANYATAGSFLFNSGDSVADSSHGGAGGTDIQLYTVSYIVNVDGAQGAGTYNTTLSYICTAQF